MNSLSRQRALAFVRSLADPNRLRLLGALAGPERRLADLAAALDLPPPVVAHHLTHLRQLGLLTSHVGEADAAYRLDLEVLRRFCREVAAPEPSVSFDPETEAADWERDVLKHFFVGERLKEIPASAKKRQPVLKWLASRFTPDTRYPEAEVNALLQRHHPDCAALRRYLVDEGYLRRDHGTYWRNLERG